MTMATHSDATKESERRRGPGRHRATADQPWDQRSYNVVTTPLLRIVSDSSCGEEELSPLVHHPTCGLSKQLKNGTAWSSYPGHRDPWKGKGQKRPLPTPFCRRDARRHWIVVVPQRPLRHYYYSRKADVFPLGLVNKRPQSVRRRGEDVSPVRAEQQAFPRVPRNTARYTR
ncbi:uncharacterized protein [Temnothorax nylanderi]|uniref:uncharacterized protein n=1 Tax=Temnothorax nylanderi TaxID=102681 RepID=UPI003A846844